MPQKKKTNLKSKKYQPKSFWSARNIVIILVVLTAISASYFLFFKKSTLNEPKWVKEGEVTFLNKDSRKHLAKIDVEVAANPNRRMQGLMFRSQMDEDKGMMFIFDTMEMQSFWMKNTIMPLDIIFI